jgi:hypothetical protein
VGGLLDPQAPVVAAQGSAHGADHGEDMRVWIQA